MNSDFIVVIAALVLGCLIPIVSIIVQHFTKKDKMRVMEKAIEKGLSLEGLSLDEKGGARMPYRAGMVSVAVGLGVCIFGVLVGQAQAHLLYPIVGGGSIAILIGVALIINDRINYDRYFNKESDPQ